MRLSMSTEAILEREGITKYKGQLIFPDGTRELVETSSAGVRAADFLFD